MTIFSRYWCLLNLHAFCYNRFRCHSFPLFSFTTRRFFGFNLPNFSNFHRPKLLPRSRSLKYWKATYKNRRRYLWIQAAEQAWYACVHQTCLIRPSKPPNKTSSIKHENKRNVLSCLIECLMAFKFYQTRSNSTKQGVQTVKCLVTKHFPFGQAVTLANIQIKNNNLQWHEMLSLLHDIASVNEGQGSDIDCNRCQYSDKRRTTENCYK